MENAKELKEELLLAYKMQLSEYEFIMSMLNSGTYVDRVWIPDSVLNEVNDNLKSFAEKRIKELKQELNNL